MDLDVPEAPGHRVTIACTLLENRAKPKIRRQQMEELLNIVRDTANPVVRSRWHEHDRIGFDANRRGKQAV